MNYYRYFRMICIIFLAIFFLKANAQTAEQTLQIRTHFQQQIGNPTWLVIIRDMQNGRLFPYLFDIRQKDNFWVAFSNSRVYRVTVSQLKFDSFAVTNNFCDLENTVMDGKSIFITLTGILSPDSSKINCHVLRYRDVPFPIATDTDEEK